MDTDLEKDTDLVLFNAYNAAFIVAQQGTAYPFELIKTRVQISSAQGGSELAAMAEVARGVVADRGVVRGLFHGFPWLVGPMLFCEGLYYTTYVVLKRAMHDIAGHCVAPKHREAADFAIPFVAGGLAEALNTIVSVPTDIVTQRLQILPRQLERSAPAVVRSVIAEQGLVGLFRGTTVTIASYVPFSAVWLGTYEALKGVIARLDRENEVAANDPASLHKHSDTSSQWREHLVHAWCGAVAAVAATVVTNPIDVVKTRMQTHGAPSYLSVSQQSNRCAQSQTTVGNLHALRQRSEWYHLRYQKHLMQQGAVVKLEARRFCTTTPSAQMPRSIGSDTGVRLRQLCLSLSFISWPVFPSLLCAPLHLRYCPRLSVSAMLAFLQLRAICKSMQHILREQGFWRGLMRGVVPRTLYNAPSSALSLVCYELSLKLASSEAGDADSQPLAQQTMQ